MKQRIFSTGIFMAVVALLLVSCEEKKEEDDALVGTYVFTSATFNDTVDITVQDIEIKFLPGTDAAAFVGPGLLGAAPCDDPQNAAIELKNEGSTYFTCLNEANQEQLGTWLINKDRTILTLNISNPQPFSLTISNLEITSTSFSGTVQNFPLPKDTGYDLGTLLPGGTDINYQIASVDLSFTKVL